MKQAYFYVDGLEFRKKAFTLLSKQNYFTIIAITKLNFVIIQNYFQSHVVLALSCPYPGRILILLISKRMYS